MMHPTTKPPAPGFFRSLQTCLATVLALVLLSGPVIALPEENEAGQSENYRQGKRALDAKRWGEAREYFERAVALQSTESGKSDAALYWLAYALQKNGQSGEALEVLSRLRHDQFSGSPWLDDARALEIEIRGQGAGALEPEQETQDELKLIALYGLMERDPSRAMPHLKKILAESSNPQMRGKVLFVLGQSDEPEARKMILEMARGESDKELQRQAIRFLAIAVSEDAETMQILEEIYRNTDDLEVRKEVLHGFMINEEVERILEAARSESNPELRAAAVHNLGVMEAVDSLRALYRSEKSIEVKGQILHSLFIADDMDTLLQVARTDPEDELRRRAIHSIGLMDGEASLAALDELYRSEESTEVRKAVVDAWFHQDAAAPLIAVVRETGNSELRKAALRHLARMDTPEAEAILLEILEE